MKVLLSKEEISILNNELFRDFFRGIDFINTYFETNEDRQMKNTRNISLKNEILLLLS